MEHGRIYCWRRSDWCGCWICRGGCCRVVGQNVTVAWGGTIAGASGGLVKGAVSGGGFTALSGETAADILEGTWKGAISGLAGGAVGAYIGGGAGAFAGGAVSGGLGTALHGGDTGSIAKSALFGGAFAWGGFQIQQGFAYRENSRNGGTFTYKQFRKMSVASQRSFSRGKEFGGWILDNGDVSMWTERVSGSSIQLSTRPSNTIGEFHTHPNLGGTWVEQHSPTDMTAAVDPSYVIGRQNLWFYNPSLKSLPSIFYRTADFNSYPYNLYWFELQK